MSQQRGTPARNNPYYLKHTMRFYYFSMNEEIINLSGILFLGLAIVCAKMSNPIGPSGLQKRLMKFDYKRCHPQMVARAREILDQIHFDDIVKASRGGACFYVYVSDLVSSLTYIHFISG